MGGELESLSFDEPFISSSGNRACRPHLGSKILRTTPTFPGTDGLIPAKFTADEVERLRTLRSLSILDSLPEDLYEGVVALAAASCDTPIALVTFVDEKRQWFKARIGLNASETPRDHSFCAHAIHHPREVFEVPDAHADERFVDNPLVTGDLNVRFYAGAPIVTRDGRALGTVCVIDTNVRRLTANQRHLLSALASQTAALLDLRERTVTIEGLANKLDRVARESERQREETDNLFELLLKSGNFGFYDINLVTKTITANPRLREMLGVGPDVKLDGVDWRSILHPDDLKKVNDAALHHDNSGSEPFEYEHRIRHADGHYFFVNDRSIVVERNSRGHPTRIIGTQQDVTKRIQVEHELHLANESMRRTNEMAKVGGWQVDLESRQITWSDEVYHIHDVNPLVEPKIDTALDFYPPDARAVMTEAMRKAIEDGTSWDLELPLISATGRDLWVRSQGRADFAQGHVVRLSGALQDITERKNIEIELLRMNDRLSELSQTDALTQIPNRRCFDSALSTEWRRHMRSHGSLSLLLLDIDHFKLYNDHYGHLAGDQCLREIAKCLDSNFERAGETLARYGGEEFVVLLPDTDQLHAMTMAEKCVREVKRLQIEHLGLSADGYISISVGVACVIPDAKDLELSLVAAADQALYRAKRAGRGRMSL